MKSRMWIIVLICLQLCFPIPIFAQDPPNTGQTQATAQIVGKGTHVLDAATLDSISSLTISRGSTAVIDFGGGSQLKLSGDLVNKGHLFIGSSNQAVTAAQISAANIVNRQGAELSSALPNGGVGGFTSSVANMDLVLSAVQNILNQGTIRSSGNLSMTAGGSIINIPGTTGTAPVMQAVNNINLQAASIVNGGLIASQLGTIAAYTSQLVNSGSIQAQAGNVQIANLSGNSLTVDNTLGQITAQNSILFQTLGSTSESKATLSVSGGTLSAEDVSFVSPDGRVSVAVDRLDGNVSVSGGTAEIGAQEGDVKLAEVHLTGDPILYAQGGSLDLSGLFSSSSTFSTTGGDFIALASGDITAATAPANATVDASSGSGPGGKIVLAAGFNFFVDTNQIGCSDCSGAYFVNSPSSTGGSINLPGVSFLTNNNVSLAAAAAGGPGGSVTTGSIRAGSAGVSGDRDISMPVIDVSAVGNGNGGSIFIITTQRLLGPAGGPLSLLANGGGTGNGGSIVLILGGPLAIGSGAGEVTISATGGSSGSSSGDGGTVNLFHTFFDFAGNVVTLDPAALNVAPLGAHGRGGSISLNSNGTLNLVNGGVINASGVGNGDGGSIDISLMQGATLQVTGAGPVTLAANGAGTGNGGHVRVDVPFDTTDLSIGPAAGSNLIISATGGSPGSTSGDGGFVELRTGGNITLDLTALNVAPLGASGNGGTIHLFTNNFSNFAGANVNLVNAGVINAGGVGSGNGGSIVIAGATLQVTGSGPVALTANGGSTGNGGEINVLLSGAGDVAIGSAAGNLVTSATGGSAGSASGNGGRVDVETSGNLTIDLTSLNVAPLGSDGNGGTIFFRGSSLSLVNGAVIDESGVGNGSGGHITLQAGTLQLPAGGPFTLKANGAGTGNGGSIYLGTDGDMVIGSGAGNFILSATGGSSSGDGGSVTLQSIFGSVTVDAAFLNVAPLGTSGNGGNFTFDVHQTLSFVGGNIINASAVGNGNGGIIDVLFAGTLQLPAAGPFTFASNGAGTGNGGFLSLTLGGDLAIGSGAGQLIISSTGGSPGSASGNGGPVFVNTFGNITLDPASLNVAPQGFNGNGGFIQLSTSGNLNITNGSAINVSGVGDGNGGSINLSAFTLQLPETGPFTLKANGAGTGGGGTVFVSTAGDLAIGSAAGNMIISATGGSPSSASGDGGFVILQSFANLSIDLGSLNIAPLGSDGNGGFIGLSVGANLNITNGSAINVSGVGNGNGGFINVNTFTLQLPQAGTFTLAANGAGTGRGGFVGVTTAGDLAIGSAAGNMIILATGGSSGSSSGDGGNVSLQCANLTLDLASLNVAPLGTNGNGGSINLFVGGNLNITNGSAINASGVGNGNGGFINVNAFTLQLQAAGPLTLAANGAGMGGGGFIFCTLTNELVVGSGAGQLIISATGGSPGSASGNGGTVNLQSFNGDLTLDPASLNVAPLGNDGNGGSISLTAGANLNITSGSEINASGVGNGNGGRISLAGATLQVTGAGPVTLAANGAGMGSGGSISLSTPSDLTIGSGTGNFIVSATGGSPGSATGDGGNVHIEVFSHNITVDPSFLNVSPLGTNGNGGAIELNIFSSGSLNFSKGGVLNASGVGNGSGGVIRLIAPTVNVQKGNVSLAANGAGFGSGGFVSVTSFAAGGDLELGSGNRALSISVSGGSLGGQEGIVQIFCFGGMLTIDYGAKSTVNFLNLQDVVNVFGNIIFRGASLNNAGSIFVVGNGTFQATSTGGPLTLSNSGSIFVPTSIHLTANGGSATLNNQGSIFTFGQLQLMSNGGSSTITGGGGLTALGGISLESNGRAAGHANSPAVAPAGETNLPDSSVANPFSAGSTLPPTDLVGPPHPTAEPGSSSSGDKSKGGQKASADAGNDDSELVLVSLLQPVAPSTSVFKNGIHTLSHATATIKHDDQADLRADNTGALLLSGGGEALVIASRDTVVKAGIAQVSIRKGAIAALRGDGDGVMVRNLYETRRNSVTVYIKGEHSLQLAVGHEVVLGNNDRAVRATLQDHLIGRRKLTHNDFSCGVSAASCEFSLPALMQNSYVLQKMAGSNDKGDRAITGKLTKMAACLHILGASRGAYSSGGRL